MKRKVASGDLEVGMYVVALDRPWLQAPFEQPFDLAPFTIRSEHEVEKVRDLCRFVYIDPDRGKPAKEYVQDSARLRDVTKVLGNISSDSTPAETYKDETTLQQELPKARQVLDDTHDVYVKVITDIGHDRKPDVVAVQNSVTGLVESVIRNPEALSWLTELKRKNQSTYTHSISLAVLALAMGRFLGLPKDQLEVLGASTLLQDIGKLAVPTEILDKATRLDTTERHSIREHVHESVHMLQEARDVDPEVVNTVQLHHERYDGSGYPKGLKEQEVPLLATLSGMVDCYQAGTSERPYRPAKTSFQVLMELYGERDRAFPAAVVEQFIQCVGIFPIGAFVQLNSGEVGVIVRRNQIQQLKPHVMIVLDSHGCRVKEPATVDLATQSVEPGSTSRTIVKVVDPEHYNLNPNEFFV